MQTTVTQYLAGVVPGTMGPNQESAVIRTAIAGETIPFGVMCEVDSSNVAWLPKSSSLNVLGGVSLRQQFRMGGTFAPSGTSSYLAGEAVPLMRKGQVYAAYDGGGTVAPYAAANVDHSTTTATNRGQFTASATSTTAGSEIAALPAGSTAVFYEAANNSGAVLLSIELP